MGAGHRRKKKSGRGNKSKDDFCKAGSASATPSSFADETESSEDSQKEDGVQPYIKSLQNQQIKQPACPIKKPPTPYRIFIKDKIVRNNPGMNSKDISSLIGKMYKTLSEKKKQKYVELARVAREEYKKQVQEFKEANPIPKLAPLAPTPFSIYCRERRQSISQGKNKFPLLSEKDKLEWINRALAEEANYIDQFEIFKADNPNFKPKITPVLNEEEKLLVYMRCLFASEYPSIPAMKDKTPTEMAQWTTSWNALSKAEKKVYQERVIAMKHEFNVKLSAYNSKLPFEKRGQETTNNFLPDVKGTKRKKGPETYSSAPFKKSKTSFREEKDSHSSEEQGSSTLPNGRCKKKAAQVKRYVKKSSTIVVDSSADSDNCDDISLLKKKLTIESKSTESSEESSGVSDSEPEQSNVPKKTISMLGASVSSALSKKPKFGIGNSSPHVDTNGSDPTSTSSSDDDQTKTSRASSCSSNSGKKISLTERSAIQNEEDTSEEDESDSSEEESSGPNITKSSAMASSSKPNNGITPIGKTLKILSKTSTAVDSSDDSNSDDSDRDSSSNKKKVAPKSAKISSNQSSTSSSDNKSQEMIHSSSSSSKTNKSIAPLETLTAIQSEEETSDEDGSDTSNEDDESNGPDTKSSGEETDGSSASSEKSKTSSSNQNEPSEKEELSTLSIINIKTSSIGKDSSSSVRPLWALQQKLFKNEPPKPPKTAAEWHAFEICQVPNIPEEKMKKLWNGLKEKKRKMLKIEHTKRLEEYEEKLQAFKNGLSKTELQAFEHIKRSQRVDSEDDSD